MSEKFANKNIKLSIQFDKYLWKNPELLDQIPNKSTVIITVKGDHYFNRVSRTLPKGYSKRVGRVVEARKEGSKWKIVA